MTLPFSMVLTKVIGAAFHCERRECVFERDVRLFGTGIFYSSLPNKSFRASKRESTGFSCS